MGQIYLKEPGDGVNERVGLGEASDVDRVAGPDQALVGRVHDLERDPRCDWKRRNTFWPLTLIKMGNTWSSDKEESLTCTITFPFINKLGCYLR